MVSSRIDSFVLLNNLIEEILMNFLSGSNCTACSSSELESRFAKFFTTRRILTDSSRIDSLASLNSLLKKD